MVALVLAFYIGKRSDIIRIKSCFFLFINAMTFDYIRIKYHKISIVQYVIYDDIIYNFKVFKIFG